MFSQFIFSPITRVSPISQFNFSPISPTSPPPPLPPRSRHASAPRPALSLAQGELTKYMQLLVEQFNPKTLPELMCRSLLSVSHDGSLFDCDFNQALDIGLGERSVTPVARSIFDLRSLGDLEGGEVLTGEAPAARHPCLRRLTRVLGAQATTASAAPRGWGRADRGRRCSTRHYTCESSSAVHALCRRVHAWGPRQPSPTRILAARK